MNSNQRIYFIAFVSVAVIVLLIIFVIKPLFLEIKKTSAQAMESRERLLSFERIDKGYLERVEEDYKTINENLSFAKNQLVDKNEAVRFFEALELLASSTYNKLEINAGNFPDLTISLTGTFPDFMKFLGWLENGDYFINVNSISMRRSSEREDPEIISTNEIKTNMSIKIYTKE